MRFGNPSKKSKTIASLKGHAVEFPGKVVMKDGKPPADYVPPVGAKLDADGITFVFVPPPMHAEVISAGMLAEEEMAEEVDTTAKPVKPEDPVKLQEQAFEAFKVLKELNQREDFAGNGLPKPAAVEKLVGYAITNSELKDLWTKFQTAAAE